MSVYEVNKKVLGKIMEEDDIDSSLDWKQTKGFSKNTRVSRRLDQEKAMALSDLDKNNFKNTPKTVKKVAPNLKKIQKKIRDIYDDEEDDEDENSPIVFDFGFEDQSSSLYSVLSDEEKTRLNANKNFEDQKMQQAAGKVADILKAEQTSKNIGLKSINKKIIAKTTQDVTFDGKTYEKTLLKNISDQTKLKTEKISSKDTVNLVSGIEKMKHTGILSKENNLNKLSENMEAKDFIEIGKEKNKTKTAKLILEKSGRKENEEKLATKQKDKKEKIKKIEKSLNKIKSR